MKISHSSIIFVSGIIIVILSLILIFLINKATDIASNVLLPTGALLLLVGSFFPDNKNIGS